MFSSLVIERFRAVQSLPTKFRTSSQLCGVSAARLIVSVLQPADSALISRQQAAVRNQHANCPTANDKVGSKLMKTVGAASERYRFSRVGGQALKGVNVGLFARNMSPNECCCCSCLCWMCN